MTDDALRLEDYRPRSSLRVAGRTRSAGRGSPPSTRTTTSGPPFGGEWATREPAELIATLDEAGDRDGRRPRRRPGRGPLGRDRAMAGRVPGPGRRVRRARLRRVAARPRRSARPRPAGSGTPPPAARAGLKVWKLLGLRARDPDGRLVAVDDPRLDPLWAAAAELDLPVLIHIADPIAFFEPLDATNERWEELHAHPGLALLAAAAGRRRRRTRLSRRSTRSSRRSGGSSRATRRRRSWAPTSAARPRTSRSSAGCSTRTRTSRRHRGAARRAGPAAVHEPGVLPALRRPDPVRHRHGARSRPLRDPLPVPRDLRRVVRLRHGRRCPARAAGRSTGSACPTRSCARSTATTPAGSSGWRRRDRRPADGHTGSGTRRGLDACASAAGTFAVLALDHRQNLRRHSTRTTPRRSTYEEMVEFKRAVVRSLAPVATGTLLDPEIGAAQCIADGSLPAASGL